MVRVAAIFVSTMQFSGGVGVTTAVPCMPPIGMDGVACHPASGPSATGLLSWVSAIYRELSFHLIIRSRRNFILFIFTGSEPPERGLTLVGLSPFVLIRYALKVELRGILRGGGALS
jgi:hypothetical protein